MGIALLVRTLRERLRSVTRDWGLGIGDCTSGADATRTAPLCYQGLGIGDWGFRVLHSVDLFTIKVMINQSLKLRILINAHND
ncbi:MAG: hypothetical protein ACFKPT_04850 [Gloeotrichia echinulata GP01]